MQSMSVTVVSSLILISGRSQNRLSRDRQSTPSVEQRDPLTSLHSTGWGYGCLSPVPCPPSLSVAAPRTDVPHLAMDLTVTGLGATVKIVATYQYPEAITSNVFL